MLNSREEQIDDLIEKTKHQGYTTFLSLFQTSFSYASDLFLNSAMKGQLLLGTQLKKSLSMNDDMDFLAAQQQSSSSSASSSINTSNKQINEKQNDLYDMENNDVDGQVERIRRINNNKTIYDQQVQQVYQQQQAQAQAQKQQRNPRKGSMAQLNGASKGSSSNSNIYSTFNGKPVMADNYAMLEQDGIMIDHNEDTEQLLPPTTKVTKTKKTTTRRASSRKLLQQQPEALDSYGTLTTTRAKASSTTRQRNKLNSVPTLISSQQQQQPIVVHDDDI